LADFLAACQRQDKAFLSQIPGIGPKMAARIFAEIVLERFPLQATVPSGVAQWQQQASAVLLNLGFDAASIHKALGQCLSTSLDALIKEALQKLGEQRA
jgi:Holliday junction resolvasome RuvABC DNA-binding subunit